MGKQGVGERRALVELAMVRDGEGLSARGLARELGVSEWTARRDMALVRARWAGATGEDGDVAAEQERTAAAYEAVAGLAWGQFARLAEGGGNHNAMVGYLRVATDALEKRAKLLGLEREKGGSGKWEWVDRAEESYTPSWAMSDEELGWDG